MATAEMKEFGAAKKHILKTVEETLEDGETLKCLIYDRAAYDRAMHILSNLVVELRKRRDAYIANEGHETLGAMLNAMSQLLGAVQICSAFLKCKVSRAK